MKRDALCIFTCMFLFFVTASGNAQTKEKKKNSTDKNKKNEAWVPVDSATMITAYMEYATPGAPHATLARFDGNWIAEMVMWMGKGTNADTMVGSCVNTMIMDGRYQRSEYQADFMGMPFNGMGITGYDNHEKVFKSTWVDNMGTGIMIMKGTWDESSKSLKQSGSTANPANGQEWTVRQVLRIVNDDTHIMEMYGPDPQTGEEYKTMEIKYTRRK